MTHPRTPAHRRARGRTLAAGALALTASLGLSACGSQPDSGSGSGTKASGEDAGTHVVDTYKGEVTVPNDPERVVVLDTAELDSAVTLGVTPVGATKAEAGSGFLSYLPKGELADVQNVGTITEPNLEKIAGLDPDLILTNAVRHEKIYDKLSAIAPTVMTESTGKVWKENFLVHAEALGKEDKGRQVVAEYEKHVAKVTEAIGGKKAAKELETNIVRFVEGADTRIYGDGSYIRTILEDVGLGRPAIVDKATAYDGLMLEISPEQIDKADADVLFYTSYGDPEKSGEKKATGSPLWQNMQVVQEGNAYRVDDELWIQGIGYTAAGKILDQMAEFLTE